MGKVVSCCPLAADGWAVRNESPTPCLLGQVWAHLVFRVMGSRQALPFWQQVGYEHHAQACESIPEHRKEDEQSSVQDIVK